MLAPFRSDFNRRYNPVSYQRLLAELARKTGSSIDFRIAETPVFLEAEILRRMANAGSELLQALLSDATYLQAAFKAIPRGFCVANQDAHPNFFTADFALVRDPSGGLEPRLVEMQAFPSVFGFQQILCESYAEVFDSASSLGYFLSGLDEASYWDLLRRTIVGSHDPENVVLTEIDPEHQKTRPDFCVTARRLGISVVDITQIEPEGRRLFYRNAQGKRIPIERAYNRAIADELVRKNVQLPFNWESGWDIEWAGHPNWYFLISKFSLPWLSGRQRGLRVVPPTVGLKAFLEEDGERDLAEAGVPLPAVQSETRVFDELLLKPLFSFAGKGIEFGPSLARLRAIAPEEREGYVLQQRMAFVPTIETPFGATQAEIRILYVWPDDGNLTPVISLARLGRGKMMGVDHNRDQEWVGASAALFPPEAL